MSEGATTPRAAEPKVTTMMRGRNDDVRDVLALLDASSVVVVSGGRGIGKTLLLRTIAMRYGVPVHRARVPEEIAPGDLVVLDDAHGLSRRAMRALAQRTRAAHGRLLVSVLDHRDAPRDAAIHRLASLSPADALLLLGRGKGSEAVSLQELVMKVGGHPWLLSTANGILGEKRGPRTLKGVLDRLAKLTSKTWTEGLPVSMKRAARILVASGGVLPAKLESPKGLDAGLDLLAGAGFAEIQGPWVIASSLLVFGVEAPPGRRDLSVLLGSLRRHPVAATGLGRLAKAHLLHRLDRGEEALVEQREAYRAARGTSRGEPYRRSLMKLSESMPADSSASARLALLVDEVAGDRGVEAVIGAVNSLFEEGHLRDEEMLEARTFLAWLSMGKGKVDRAAKDLAKVAKDAAEQGNAYAEALALLWQAWLAASRDEPGVSEKLAGRALKLARLADAPVLHERALYCLGRGEILEGRLGEAESHLEQALRICNRQKLDDDWIIVLDGLAEIAGRLGRPSEAAAHLDAADSLIASSGNLPRRAELAVTRAEVAMRRGHVASARRILSSTALRPADDLGRRELLEAEVALATGDFAGVGALLEETSRRPLSTREARRRRASIYAALVEEGVSPDVDLSSVREDPVAAVVVDRAAFCLEAAEEKSRLLASSGDDDPDGKLIILGETVRLHLLRGEMQHAGDAIARLREQLVQRGSGTALVLLIEAVDHLLGSQAYRGALASISAHRSAMSLGNLRAAVTALEMLIICHLAMGRLRGMTTLMTRARRLARLLGSSERIARLAAWRLAAALRAGEKPSKVDLAEARASNNPVVGSLLGNLLDKDAAVGDCAAHGEPLAVWIARLIVTGSSEGVSGKDSDDEGSVEIFLDGDRKEAILAGGKRVCFQRRRVLWRLLWKILEAGKSAPIDPEPLYRAAWELPFNPRRLNSLYVGIRRLRLLVEPDPSSPRIILAASRGGYFADPRRVRSLGVSPFDET